MTPSSPEPDETATAAGPRPILKRVLGFVVSVSLFALALAAVGIRRDDLAQAATHASHAPAWLVVTLAILPALNLVLIGTSLWFIMARYGRVGLVEMNQLIFTAWLLNFLPMKPGLMGRVAYHKRFNHIRVRDSARALVESMALSAISIGVLLIVALAVRGAVGTLPVLLATCAPALALVLAAGVASSRWVPVARLLAAMALRYLDILVWVARYALIFQLIGADLTLADVVLVTTASQLAQLVPFAGNGLGIREWAVGVVGKASGLSMPVALSADLVNRASELVLAVPLGFGALWAVTRRVRQLRRRSEPSPATA
ncbi:MAG: hypothetical protein R3B57_14370 [Phycisphaerales bacterium]